VHFVITTVLIVAFVPPVLGAQDGISNEEAEMRLEIKARALVRITFQDQGLDAIYEQAGKTASLIMINALQSNLKRELTASENKRMNNVVYRSIRNLVSADEWEKVIAPIYSKYYSIEDLDKIVDFYKTPVGRKVLKLQGNIVREAGEAGEKLFAGKADKFQEILLKELDFGLRDNPSRSRNRPILNGFPRALA